MKIIDDNGTTLVIEFISKDLPDDEDCSGFGTTIEKAEMYAESKLRPGQRPLIHTTEEYMITGCSMMRETCRKPLMKEIFDKALELFG